MRQSDPRGNPSKIFQRWKTPVHTKGFVAGTSSGNTSFDVTAVSARAEGTIISPVPLCASSITGQVSQFIGGRAYTDKVILVTRANFIEGGLESLVRELALDIDTFTRTGISASATQRLAGGGTKVAGTGTLVGKNVARVAPYMDANNVPRWEDETFVAVTHPLDQFDIFSDPSATGFVSVARYGERQKIYKGEVGQMYGVRWLLSNAVVRVFGTNATSATTGLSGGVTGGDAWVFAPDSFYSIELEDGGVEVIHQPPGSGGSTGDPAAQVGSISVKVFYGVVASPSIDQRLMRFTHAMSLR